MKYSILLTALIVAVLLSGCKTFDINTPENMVAVEKSSREYVAMTHDGIVLRALVHKQGDGDEVGVAGEDFWVQAIRERIRTRGGYALVEEGRVKSANGHDGIQLLFGRDQEGVTFSYLLILFVTDKNVHVLDAGGRRDRFEAARPALDRAISSYEVKR